MSGKDKTSEETSGSTSATTTTTAAMTSTAELNIKIPTIKPKLSGSSTYPRWISSLQTYLSLLKVPGTKHRVWHILNGKYTELDPGKEEDDWQMWDDANGVAKLTIINNCEIEVQARIGSFQKAKDAYDELKKAYEGKSVTELGALMKSVTRLAFDDWKLSIQDYIADYGMAWNTFVAITARLDLKNDDGFGEGLKCIAKSEKAKIEFLLDSLPAFYSNTVENIKSKDENYDDVIRKLLQYIPLRQKGRKQGGDTKEDPVVLKAQVDTSKKSKYCIDVKGWKGIGHTEAKCRTKKREGKKAKTLEAEEDDDDAGNVLCIKVGKTEVKDGYFQYDTATTHHTTNQLEALTNVKNGAWEVRGHDGSKSVCKTKGTLTISHNGNIHQLDECLYDPTYSNLISGQRINQQLSTLTLEIDGFHGFISSKKAKVFDVEIDNLGGMWIRGEWGARVSRVESPKELHDRYGHILYDTLKNLPEYPKSAGAPPRCKACEKGKATKPPVPESKVGPIRTTKPLERIHCDLVGPIKPPTPAKQYQYLLVVTDDYSRYMSAKPLRTKDETSDALVEIINILKKASEHLVKHIQADWGGEFRNKDLQIELRQRGIQLKVLTLVGEVSEGVKQYPDTAKPMLLPKEPTAPFLL